MNYSGQSRVALGLIVRRLDDPAPMWRFLDNANKHGWQIDRIIVVYSHDVDWQVVEELRRKVNVDVVRAHGDRDLKEGMLALGLDGDDVEGLLDVPSWPCHNEVPYGAYRNAALFQALLSGVDYLLFFDNDVLPQVLTAHNDGRSSWQEVDFVGRHLEYLSRPDVVATSSDYSGYYIIPPMDFDGLSELLVGVGKELALDYMVDYEAHGCLNFGSESSGRIVSTNKVLGGNLGLNLRMVERLAPFFSTTYAIGEQCVLGRGEDTLLGPAILKAAGQVLDIDLRLFHDTYGDFPRVPEIGRKTVRDRFFRACLGWIGRNPFLTWFGIQAGLLAVDFDAVMERQRAGLAVGGSKAARYLNDARFESLPSALDAALAELPEVIGRYERLMGGWMALVDALEHDEILEEGDGQLPSAA